MILKDTDKPYWNPLINFLFSQGISEEVRNFQYVGRVNWQGVDIYLLPVGWLVKYNRIRQEEALKYVFA